MEADGVEKKGLLTPRSVAMYGWVSIGILFVLLALVWTGAVGESLRLPILILAVCLVASRVILRMIVERRSRKDDGGGNPPPDSP